MARGLIGAADNTHYAKAALGAIGAVRAEIRTDSIVPSTGGTRTVFRAGDVSITINDNLTFLSFTSFKTGETASTSIAIKDPNFFNTGGIGLPRYFVQPPVGSVEFLIRWQHDPILLRYTLEIWNLQGTDRLFATVVNGVGGQVVTAGNLSASDWAVGNAGFGVDRLGGNCAWFRLYNTILPLNSPAPLAAAPLAGAVHHAWEFENSLADTVGTAPMVWQGGGVATYTDSIEAPVNAPNLSSLGYFGTSPNKVQLTFDDPNSLGANEGMVDVERRIGSSGPWKKLGFTTAADVLTYDDTQILHVTDYEYRVKARNRIGESAYSNILGITTGAGVNTNPTITENAKAGTAAFKLTNPAIAREIEGYADQVSVNRGGTINLKVSSTQNFNLEVFRLGWYGGLGARRIRNILAITGAVQADPVKTGTSPAFNYECNWTTSHVLTLTDADPTEWPSGVYVARLTQVTSGKQAYIRFVVRDDTRRSELYFNDPVLTDNSYNAWPTLGNGIANYQTDGHSTYRGSVASSQVCFNRPYAIPTRADANYGTGAGDLFVQYAINPVNPRGAGSEYNWIRWLEKKGYDVQYGTDLDLHTQQDKIWGRCFGLVLPGHQEYATWQMRDTLYAARNYGRHLSFQGANPYFWPVRLQNGPVTGRVNGQMVAWKDSPDDPYALAPSPLTNYRYSTSQRYRNFGDVPINEANLVGVGTSGDPGDGSLTITAAGAAHQLMTGTGFVTGSAVAGMLGYEFDADFGFAPVGTIFLAHTANVQPGQNHDMSVYTHASNAIVFGSGTMQLIWAADDFGVAEGGRITRLNAGVETMLENLFAQQKLPVSVGSSSSSADHISIDTQPAGASSGTPFTTQLVVSARNSLGVIDTTPRTFTATIATGVAVLTGPTQAGDVSWELGEGTFRGMAAVGIGVTITIRISSPGLPDVISDPVLIGAEVDTFYRGVALPRVTPDATPINNYDGIVRLVGPGGMHATIQAAVDAANPGDIIKLKNGFFPIEDVNFPAKAQVADGLGFFKHIKITSETAPVKTTDRIQAANFTAGQAIWRTASNNGNKFLSDSNHWWFEDIRILPVLGGFDGSIFDSTIDLSLWPAVNGHHPHHIVFKRVYSVPEDGNFCRRFLYCGSEWTIIKDSTLTNFQSNATDAQSVLMVNCPGKILIENNAMSAAEETIMSGGGGDSANDNYLARDVTIRLNYLFKPLSKKGIWNAKNLFELKTGRRWLIEHNIMEGMWQAGQDFAVNLKSVNQDGSAIWDGTGDVVFRSNLILRASAVFSLNGLPQGPGVICHRLCVRNNVSLCINSTNYNGLGNHVEVAGVYDAELDHNSYFHASNGAYAFALYATGLATRVRYTNNLHLGGIYGVFASGDTSDFDEVNIDGVLENNAILGLPEGFSAGQAAMYDPSNIFEDAVVGYAADPGLTGLSTMLATDEIAHPLVLLSEVKLLPTSSLYGAGSDAQDIGAFGIDALIEALTGVYEGTPSGSTGGGTIPVGVRHLEITRQPAATIPGILATQPIVKVFNEDGSIDTTFTGLMQAFVVLGDGDVVSGGVISCVAGVGTFTVLNVEGSGDITLAFTVPILQGVIATNDLHYPYSPCSSRAHKNGR